MIPSCFDRAPDVEWTATRGEDGSEVATIDGKRAICCELSTATGADLGRRGGSDAREEGEGGSGMEASDDTLPLTLCISWSELQSSPIRFKLEHHLPVDSIVPHTIAHIAHL